MKKIFSFFIATLLILSIPSLVSAEENNNEPEADSTYSEEVTAEDLGATEAEINNATEEETKEVEETGTLIEIGNTTAEETTVVVRVTDEEGNTEDVTLEIETDETEIENSSGGESDLNDWIAGDQITFKAAENTNSGSLRAHRVDNKSIRQFHKGKNGWITEIRPEKNEMDVQWNNQIFTLNVEKAKMVAGDKNPATIEDFQVGDRIRSRVEDDGDQNPATWNAKIVVVLRRGGVLFMRVTRWVVQGEITYLPENPQVPTTITIEVLPSKFYEKNDVNNLVGDPGEELDVNITAETKLHRRYFGEALIKEFSEGDRVQVVGRLNEETGVIDAKIIRNATIQKLKVFRHVGVVTSISASTTPASLTVAGVGTGAVWQIKADEETKVIKGGEEAEFSDIKIGDRIRVRGVANRIQRVVDADTIIVLREKPHVVNERVRDMVKARKKK